MDPIAASTFPAIVRPATGAGSDLGQILREGRVLAGSIQERLGDGTLLIALGRQKVAAQTNLRFDPGQSFLFRVAHEGAETVLVVVGLAGDPEGAALLAALRGVLGEERPLGELLELAAARVRAELARPGGGAAELGELLRALQAHVFQPGEGGEGLARLFAGAGQRYEALLLAAAATRAPSPELLERLRSDLKAELLRFHAANEEGPVREAVGRVLSGLDLEQLLNVARQRAGEPSVWSLPLADGDGWTTAWFQVPPRHEEEQGRRGGEESQRRVVLGATFSALGPVRIDVVSSAEALTVRLLVTRAALVERMRGELRELADELVVAADGRTRGRAVHVFVRLGTASEATIGARPLDIGFLREHRLMDVEG